MKFIPLSIKGAYIIDLELFEDKRGFFGRTFCAKEFAAHKLNTKMVQSNWSYSKKKGTLRGMHFQKGKFAEAKLVRCVKGKIVDVIIDIRKNSKTFGKHIMTTLEDNDRILYVPKGCAHGFLTLSNHTHVFYQVSNFYNKSMERGIRWNDPFFNIPWPIKNPILSLKDANHPDFLRKK